MIILSKSSMQQLGDEFYSPSLPTAVKNPDLFLWNNELAAALELDSHLTSDENSLSQLFSGSVSPQGGSPIALAYAGHQFGHFNPRLGDGRAHLLGELNTGSLGRVDIQLKGSGKTPYSRGGDGRCALGPAIREFLMGEAMHALGVPTARALAVVKTGEPVYRETVLPGAVVTRVAASHLRVGTFEYFYAQNNLPAIEALCHYAVKRHFPELAALSLTGGKLYLAFLQAVFEKQITLVCEWMRVGFIHGVMNTDNTSISGETIDYGPCAMMNAYNPDTVFSSIDQMGRYRFGYQPHIAQWNMARLAECLLPLIDENIEVAKSQAEVLLSSFSSEFKSQFQNIIAKKIGIKTPSEESYALANELLKILESKQLDYTQTYYELSLSLDSQTYKNALADTLGDWYTSWINHLQSTGQNILSAQQLMRETNPVVIARNHHVESVIEQCSETGSADAAYAFLDVLKTPYEQKPNTHLYQDAPADGDANYRTFCGT